MQVWLEDLGWCMSHEVITCGIVTASICGNWWQNEADCAMRGA